MLVNPKAGSERADQLGLTIAATGGSTAFDRLLFADMTVEEAGCYYAYELMDAAKPLTR